MQVINGYQNCPPEARNSVIALGNFDGVHNGHKIIISSAVEKAKAEKLPSAVMTFEPHPLAVFKPDSASFRTTPLTEKAKLIEALGIDFLFVIKFDQEFAAISPEKFIEDILINDLTAKHVITGYDFTFGYKRGGDTSLLQKYADSGAFSFTRVEAIGDGGEIFSTTKIREYLTNGEPEKAAKILGRNFAISGRVIKGEQRGRKIGFPTANIALDEYIRPKFGVYACRTEIDGKIYNAIANIGIKPTFGGEKELLELHIFDFDKNIYDAILSVELIKFIRPEKKFSAIDELKKQIESDCVKAKEILT